MIQQAGAGQPTSAAGAAESSPAWSVSGMPGKQSSPQKSPARDG